MGRNSRQKKSSSSSSSSSSSFSVFSFFKSKASHKVKHTTDDSPSMLKIWPSHEDGVRWVAEPGIDKKASAFIAKFHESRIAAAN